jgi:FkbM family methyltransferase
MMSLKDLYNFILRRSKYDSTTAFVHRMLRFGLIASFVPSRSRKTHKLKKQPFKYPIVPVLNFKMIIDKDDAGISNDLYSDGIREAYITKELPKYIHQGDTVIDIGANIGYYVMQESKLVGNDGIVYAIEPVPSNFKILQDNILLNGCENVLTRNIAIGNSNRDDVIHISAMSNMCSMAKKKGYRSYIEDVPVRVLTLDTFVANNRFPDLIRMDVEGYELEILQGMKGILNVERPMKLFIEVHFDILMGKVVQFTEILQKAGFKIAVATFEAHMAVKDTWAMPILKYYDRQIGAQTGIIPITLDDFYRREYRYGQVEDLEVIFERK